MRIGLICPYSLTVPGGVQYQVLGLARALRGLGHEARVLAPCDGPPPDAGVTPLGMSVPTAANGSVAPIAPDPAAQLRLFRALRDEEFDVLNLHEPLVPGATMTACVVKSAPLVGTFHAAGHVGPYTWGRLPLRSFARRLDHRIAVSEDARALATRYIKGDYEVLFNGIEIDRFAKATPWPTEGPTIFFIGRHEPRKGLAVLLEAMAELPDEVRLWVGGTGPETEVLRERHADDHRVEWLGRISDEEKAQRTRGADVFCAPSLGGESFGIVLLEGMAAQTPTVASDLPGYSNVARAGLDALLVPPGDATALAGAIRRVLDDSSCASALVEAGTDRALEFSMDSLAEHYLDRFDEILAR
ncbi:MAG: glycosyltransferase family 4 protein [Acidimicrobiales bacterium]|nr:glycosyltransferase family 4 protein [Acidimicrobiales bacterium]